MKRKDNRTGRDRKEEKQTYYQKNKEKRLAYAKEYRAKKKASSMPDFSKESTEENRPDVNGSNKAWGNDSSKEYLLQDPCLSPVGFKKIHEDRERVIFNSGHIITKPRSESKERVDKMYNMKTEPNMAKDISSIKKDIIFIKVIMFLEAVKIIIDTIAIGWK